MNNITDHTLQYFRAKENYFWQWAENGEVIEWVDGRTICYRDELTDILKYLNKERQLPPIGTILLVLAACLENYKQKDNSEKILKEVVYYVKNKFPEADREVLLYYLHHATIFLNTVNEVPIEFRTGYKKRHLIFEIFNGSEHLPSQEVGHKIIEEFCSGRLDTLIFNQSQELYADTFLLDLKYLTVVQKKYLTSEKLQLAILTGLESLPSPSEIEIPEAEQLDLLDELEQDPKTEGISRLTRHLIAALQIPIHSQDFSDQPFGGISDITNRGNLDRLLLSELAQDNHLLTARLVNNEALYLRREEPPDKTNKERVILVDTTIRMWGTPRAIGISAALSFTRNTKNSSLIHSFALGGETTEVIDLSTKSGVVKALEQLDPALNFNASLTDFLNAQSTGSNKEYVLIAEEQGLESPEIRRFVSELKEEIFFLISVKRNGELSCHELYKGNKKLLISVKLDLEELFFKVSNKSKREKNIPVNLPAFLNRESSPLYFPTTSTRITSENSFYHATIGALAVTDIYRVLYWPKKDKGAMELLSLIEPGQYNFGFNGSSTVYIIVYNKTKRLLKLYSFYVDEPERKELDLSDQIKEGISEIVFYENSFYFNIEKSFEDDSWNLFNEYIKIDCETYKKTVCENSEHASSIFKNQKAAPSFYHLNQVRRHINNGYSVLQKAKNIYINNQGYLSVDNHHLRFNVIDGSFLWMENRKAEIDTEKSDEDLKFLNLTKNADVKFYIKNWDDGSHAMLDSRGLLHLKSSDPALPELTFVTNTEKISACWTSNGDLVGSSYFTGNQPEGKYHSENIKSALESFINRLSR